MRAPAIECSGSGRLVSVGAALEGIASQPPAAARMLPIASAAGSVLAEPLIAPRPIPTASIALRSGLAVNAAEIAGASAQSPIILASAPPPVASGAELPPDCDAVISPSAITSTGAMTLVTDALAPGFDARLAGQDVGAVAILLAAGTRLTPNAILVCRLAGIETALVHRPRVSIDIASTAHAAWLSDRLAALGCELVELGFPRDLSLVDAGSDAARLALHPGDDAAVSSDTDARMCIELPRRFDGFIAAYAALVLPAIARLLGLRLQTRSATLKRKIASAIGMTELALLRIQDAAATPLAVGDLTLPALAEAQAFALISAGLEGYRAGDSIGVTLFDDPFTVTG